MRTYGKLRELIREKFGTLGNFADAMGMDRSTLSNKINGIAAWKQDEIEKACKLLGIPMSEVHVYFFYE